MGVDKVIVIMGAINIRGYYAKILASTSLTIHTALDLHDAFRVRVAFVARMGRAGVEHFTGDGVRRGRIGKYAS
jgi:hypothetical protein